MIGTACTLAGGVALGAGVDAVRGCGGAFVVGDREGEIGEVGGLAVGADAGVGKGVLGPLSVDGGVRGEEWFLQDRRCWTLVWLMYRGFAGRGAGSCSFGRYTMLLQRTVSCVPVKQLVVTAYLWLNHQSILGRRLVVQRGR